MSVDTHRAAIVAMLQAVPDAGQVHDEEPYGRTESAFRALYAWTDPQGAQQLRGWYLRRTRTAERELGVGRTLDVHTWQLRGFATLNPEQGTGKAFDALIEAVRKAYRDDMTLGGVAQPGPLDQLSGWQLNDSGPVVLAGALCHGATLTLTTYEYLDQGE
jgi:hypothetical protein